MAGNKLKEHLTIDDLGEITEDFWEARGKVRSIGPQLKIKEPTMDSIAKSTTDMGEMLREMLKVYLQGNGCQPITRERLVQALETKMVGLPQLAEELRKIYSPASSGTSVENRERSGGESEVSEDTGVNQDTTSSGYGSPKNDDQENQQSKPEGLKHDAQVFEKEKFGNLTTRKLRRMQAYYSAVLKQAKESFKTRNVSVQEVTETTDRYNDQPEVAALKGVSTMDGVWDKFKKHTKWYNSEVVEAVIDVSGGEQDKKTLEKFWESRRSFLRHLDSNPDQQRKAQIILKLEENFEHFSDERLGQVCLTLCDLLEGTKPCLIKVEEGCVKATFAIPIDVAVKYFPLSSSMKRKFRKALPTLVRVNYSIPLELTDHSEDESTDKQTDCIPDEGFDEAGYDASASESEEEELHKTAPKARIPKLLSLATLRRGIAIGIGLMMMFFTVLAIEELAVNLAIVFRNFDVAGAAVGVVVVVFLIRFLVIFCICRNGSNPPSPAVSDIHSREEESPSNRYLSLSQRLDYSPGPIIDAAPGDSVSFLPTSLTDDASLSNPPLPPLTVSDIHSREEEAPSDRYLSQPGPSSFEGSGDEGHHYHHQHHDHRYDDQRPEYSYDSHNFVAPSLLSIIEALCHSDRTHSTKHSKGSSRSGKSSCSRRSGRLDVEQEYHSRRHSASLHLPRQRGDFDPSGRRQHSLASHHSDRYSNHHSDHHSSRLRSPRSRSPRPAFEPAHFTQVCPLPSHHQSHHVLTTSRISPPRVLPMRPTRSAEWVKPPQYYHQQQQEQLLYQQPPLQTERHHSNEPDTAASNGSNISEDVLLTAIGCLMHQEDCQIPNCSCKRVKKKFLHLLPKTRSHMHKEAGKVIEGSQRGNFDPNSRRQQMRISLTSQDIIHPHYHMTSCSHICQSEGRQKFLQRRRSRSVDLTPVVELPESCATTPGVAIHDRAEGFLSGHMFSPAMTPTGEPFRVLSPISLSADNLPALGLNDCPMAVTPMTQLGNRALGTSAARSHLSNTHRRWSVGPVNSPLPSLIEKDSPTSSDEGPSDRYTSQDSSSSLQTTSTQSSGPSGQSGKGEEEATVFGDSSISDGFYTQSSISTSATDTEESVKRRQNESDYSTRVDTADSDASHASHLSIASHASVGSHIS